MAKRLWIFVSCCLFLPLSTVLAEDSAISVPKIENAAAEWKNFDAPFWDNACKLANFKIPCSYGKPDSPREATEINIAHDGKNLYIRFTAFDEKVSAATAKPLCNYKEFRPLGDMGKMLLTGSWRKIIFEFDCNGNKYDSKDLDKDWNSYWKLRARKTDKSWQAVMMIPFESIDFNPADPKAKLKGFFGREYSHGAKEPEESSFNGGVLTQNFYEMAIE
ncbi:MAG: hypothetical protein A2X49_08045 [Lentisphaerae bacterium GWF2_52_8]|nr:MAG: hypothetical protein A2X49_08045 [Lentisphaerae bacterium GWF2_52_8]